MRMRRHLCAGSAVPASRWCHAPQDALGYTRRIRVRHRTCKRPSATGICFDQACQQHLDKLVVASIGLPITLAVVAYILLCGEKPAANEKEKEAKDLEFTAQSYTAWPVQQDITAERLRIDIGPVRTQQKQKRTYVFERLLLQPSQILAITLPRPMGIVFEEDAKRQRVVIGGLIEGSIAHQRAQVAKLNTDKRATAPQVGDVLRACTCTNFVYRGASALFGVKAPERTIVLYGADYQSWPKVIAALKKGESADGPVTLVLERGL